MNCLSWDGLLWTISQMKQHILFCNGGDVSGDAHTIRMDYIHIFRNLNLSGAVNIYNVHYSASLIPYVLEKTVALPLLMVL